MPDFIDTDGLRAGGRDLIRRVGDLLNMPAILSGCVSGVQSVEAGLPGGLSEAVGAFAAGWGRECQLMGQDVVTLGGTLVSAANLYERVEADVATAMR